MILIDSICSRGRLVRHLAGRMTSVIPSPRPLVAATFYFMLAMDVCKPVT
jgi:hypothetical protein